MGADTLELPKELRQGGALRAATEQGGERMLVGIELGEAFDAKEGSQKEGLEASPQGLVAVMQEGKVVIRMRLLVARDGLLKLSDHRVEDALLIEPMLKEMEAYRGQTGLYPDDLGPAGRWPMTGGVARAPLRAAKLPLTPQAVEMTDTDIEGRMTLGHLVEQESTGALRVFMQQVQQESFVDDIELSTRKKGWT